MWSCLHFVPDLANANIIIGNLTEAPNFCAYVYPCNLHILLPYTM